MTEAKISEIKRKLKKGEPEGEIKQSLKQEGYSDSEIQKAFKAHQYDMRSWYLFFGIAIILFGVYDAIMNERLLFFVLGMLLIYSYNRERKRISK